MVACGEDIGGSDGGQAVEEHVNGDLEAALRAGEEVLGREERQRLDEVDC